MGIENKKILFIIAQQNFRDEEFTVPKQILEAAGAKITVASPTTGVAIGMFELRVKPDIAVIDARESDYDALIIAGGSGSPKLADAPDVLNLIRRFNAAGKLVASICLATYILARAGILKGRSATVFPADFALTELNRASAIYEEKHVVVDGKLITADGPEAAEEFAKNIVKVLNEKT